MEIVTVAITVRAIMAAITVMAACIMEDMECTAAMVDTTNIAQVLQNLEA